MGMNMEPNKKRRLVIADDSDPESKDIFDRKALFEYMQVVSKKLATAAKMNITIKAFSMFSEDIKDHFRMACLNVFVMLRTERDSIFNNINDFRFVIHQKLVEVDILKANGKTIVPVCVLLWARPWSTDSKSYATATVSIYNDGSVVMDLRPKFVQCD
eukprot:m51a1_g2409 hypothetical protein (158) ;mRNA; r:779933-784339